MRTKVAVEWGLIALLLTGCGNSAGSHSPRDQSGDTIQGGHGNNSHAESTLPTLIQVELKVPKAVKAQQATIISARVTQGDQIVDDADKVEFEYWKEGEAHVRIAGTLHEDRTYQLQHTFQTPGSYHVISHVTVREMHSMPEKTFEVK